MRPAPFAFHAFFLSAGGSSATFEVVSDLPKASTSRGPRTAAIWRTASGTTRFFGSSIMSHIVCTAFSQNWLKLQPMLAAFKVALAAKLFAILTVLSSGFLATIKLTTRQHKKNSFFY